VSGAIATQVWQVAAKENQLEKVQDELHQVRNCVAVQGLQLHMGRGVGGQVAVVY
jgi:hypothetical protein